MKNILPILKNKFALIISFFFTLIIIYRVKNYTKYYTFLDNIDEYKLGLINYRFSYVSMIIIIMIIAIISYWVGHNIRKKYDIMIEPIFFRNSKGKIVALHNIYMFIPSYVEFFIFLFSTSLLFFLNIIEKNHLLQSNIKFNNIFDEYTVSFFFLSLYILVIYIFTYICFKKRAKYVIQYNKSLKNKLNKIIDNTRVKYEDDLNLFQVHNELNNLYKYFLNFSDSDIIKKSMYTLEISNSEYNKSFLDDFDIIIKIKEKLENEFDKYSKWFASNKNILTNLTNGNVIKRELELNMPHYNYYKERVHLLNNYNMEKLYSSNAFYSLFKYRKGVVGENSVRKILNKLDVTYYENLNINYCDDPTKGVQLDALVIAKNKIITIETKNFGGDLIEFNKSGYFSLYRGSKVETIPVLNQVSHHNHVLRKIFGDDIDIENIILFADQKTKIDDQSNGEYKLKVIYIDLLDFLIRDYGKPSKLFKESIQRKIDKHLVEEKKYLHYDLKKVIKYISDFNNRIEFEVVSECLSKLERDIFSSRGSEYSETEFNDMFHNRILHEIKKSDLTQTQKDDFCKYLNNKPFNNNGNYFYTMYYNELRLNYLNIYNKIICENIGIRNAMDVIKGNKD